MGDRPGEGIMSSTRRHFLAATAATSLVSRTAIGEDAKSAARTTADDDLPPPRYQLAMNLEIMFPRAMPYEERIEQVARCGAKHYGFWGHAGKDLDRMLEVQHKNG